MASIKSVYQKPLDSLDNLGGQLGFHIAGYLRNGDEVFKTAQVDGGLRLKNNCIAKSNS